MKQLISIALVLGLASPAFADDRRQVRHQHFEYADVIDVEPLYRKVSYEQPKRECWVENQQHVVQNQHQYEGNRNHRQRTSGSGGDLLIGGIIGGVIGNQITKGSRSSTRDGATALGAIVGSVIANEARGSTTHRNKRQRHANNTRHSTTTVTRPVERCENTVEIRYEKRLYAYEVTYEYRGQTYSTRMANDPGSQIRLKVNVEPVPNR